MLAARSRTADVAVMEEGLEEVVEEESCTAVFQPSGSHRAIQSRYNEELGGYYSESCLVMYDRRSLLMRLTSIDVLIPKLRKQERDEKDKGSNLPAISCNTLVVDWPMNGKEQRSLPMLFLQSITIFVKLSHLHLDEVDLIQQRRLTCVEFVCAGVSGKIEDVKVARLVNKKFPASG